MPVWHERTKAAVANGELTVVGVIQEQHAARCRLFAQWKNFAWPILHDPVNLLGPRAVPIVVALDERGIVRALNPKPDRFAEFLASDSIDAATTVRKTVTRHGLYTDTIEAANKQPIDADEYREIGDGFLLWGGEKDLGAAIQAYRKAAALTHDAPTDFRLGVALRRRYESAARKPNDFQAAIAHWNRALEKDPNQYIYRRRIQQYGPRMAKPYAFYDWIAQAQEEIRARGDQPIAIEVELTRAERAFPAKQSDFGNEPAQEPDPANRISHDHENLVGIETTVVPPSAKPGSTVRVFLELIPDDKRQVHWTNDAGPTTVWIDGPASARPTPLKVEKSLWEINVTRSATSDETRVVEFEAQLPDGLAKSSELSGYVLYYVCVGESGTCLYRRQDFKVAIGVRSDDAPP